MRGPTSEEIIAEINKVESDAAYANSNSSYNVSNRNTVGLLAYCAALQAGAENKPISDTEKKFVTQFLENAIGNLELNSNINTIATGSLRDTGFSGAALGDLRVFSFKTRHFDVFDDVAAKMSEVNTHLQAGTDLDPGRRLSLKEFGAVSDMSKIHATLELMSQAGLLEGSAKLQKLHSDCAVAKQLVTTLESQYKNTMQVEPGTMVFDNTQKKSAVKGMTMSFYDKLVDKAVTKHTHSSTLYMGAADKKNSDAGDAVKISHINPRHESRDFDMSEFLYADLYKIDLKKLISRQDQQELKTQLGDNWLEILNGEYKEVERSLHDNNVRNLGGIRAVDDAQQTKAGLMTLTARIGYKTSAKTDFSQVHQRMFSDYYQQNNGNMLCSAFVAHTTIASLVELNQRIKSVHNIDLGHDPIKMPIGKHEDLNVMHPGRFLSILKSKDCVQKVEPPAVIAKHIKKE